MLQNRRITILKLVDDEILQHRDQHAYGFCGILYAVQQHIGVASVIGMPVVEYVIRVERIHPPPIPGVKHHHPGGTGRVRLAVPQDGNIMPVLV